MKKILKSIAALIIFSMVAEIGGPVLATSADYQSQNANTNETNVEFDAKISSVGTDGTISAGNYETDLDIYTGGLLNITIKVSDTGYLKDGMITFKDNNYFMNDFSNVSVEKFETKTTTTPTENETEEENETTVKPAIDSSALQNATMVPLSTEDISTNFEMVGIDTVGKSAVESQIKTAEFDDSFGILNIDAPVPVSQLEKQAKEETEEKTTTPVVDLPTTEESKISENSFVEVEDNEIIKEVTADGIKLNEILAGRIVTISLPITLPVSDYIAEDIFERESTISFEGTYLNEKGKEKKVNKSIKEHVKWKTSAAMELSQELFRFLKYDENKVLVSMKLTDKVKDNRIPYVSKDYTITIPQIADKLPTTVFASGTDMTYNVSGEYLYVTKKNNRDNSNQLKWTSEDTTIITYIYEVDNVPNPTIISSNITLNVNLPAGEKIETKLEDLRYELKGEKGNLIDLTVAGPQELNKGFMYTNLVKEQNKFDTEFYEVYTVNVGYRELIDKIEIKQSNDNAILVTKNISIDPEEFLDVLGLEGYIDVFNSADEKIGTINTKNLNFDIANQSNIKLVTSKPVGEANMSLMVKKAIRADVTDATRQTIRDLKKLTDKIDMSGYLENTKISNTHVEFPINLTEPSSKAKVEFSSGNLTTTEVNKDVVITATLETDSVNDSLYKDPQLFFKLPDEVKNVNITEAQLLYEDELKPVNVEVSNNVIKVTLSGTQTKYSTQAVSAGTSVRIIADISLDKLAITKPTTVDLTYTNAATGEVNQTTAETNVIAPTDFVMTNTLKLTDKDPLEAEEGKPKEIKIKGFEGKEYTATVTGNVVNNLGTASAGTVILGRTLSSGVTMPNGTDTDLGTTFDTKLTQGIEVTSLAKDKYKVYYSASGIATKDLNDSSNGWTETLLENAKSYMIVINGNLENGEKVSFNYMSLLKRDIDYDNVDIETFSVYYTKEGNAGVKNAASCTVRTSTKPFIETQISAKKYTTGEEIYQNTGVSLNDYIAYTISIKNTSGGTAENVAAYVSFDKDNGASTSKFVSKKYLSDFNDTISSQYLVSGATDYGAGITYDSDSGKLKINVESIKSNETKTYTVYGKANSTHGQNVLRLKVTADELDESSDNTFTTTINKVEIEGKLTKSQVNNTIVAGDYVDITLKMYNTLDFPLKKIKATATLPSDFEFENSEDFKYNGLLRTLTIEEKDVKYGEMTYSEAILKVKSNAKTSTQYLTFDIEYEYENEEGKTIKEKTKSNSLKLDVQSISSYEISFTSDKSAGKLKATDQLTYYITAKNTSTNNDVTINVEDTLPKELYLEKALYTSGTNEKEINLIDGKIKQNVQIGPNESFTITIRTYPSLISQTTTVINKPIVKVNNVDANVKELKHVIEPNLISDTKASTGTSESSSNNDQSSIYYNSNNNNSNNGININKAANVTTGNSILGVAWDDKNANGQREGNEQSVQGVQFILYNKTTNTIANGIDGKEITAVTDNFGKYELKNVPSGSYYVIALYDSSTYGLSKYKATGVSDSMNSDFVESMLNNKRVGASDTITVTNGYIYNIDLGLDSTQRFDLRLDKVVTKITVTNPNKKTSSTDYTGKNLVKREFVASRVNNDTILIEYSVRVSNEGRVPGFAKTIIDYVPDGMTFNSDLNTNWYLKDDKLYTNAFANTEIKPGEAYEIKLVLSKKMTGETVGLIHNVAEITETYNTLALSDSDSIAGNKKDGEDDMSYADVFTSIKTGAQQVGEILIYTAGLLFLVGLASVVFKAEKDNRKNKMNVWKRGGKRNAKK